MSKYIAISKLEIVESVQQRADGIDQATVDEYVLAIEQAREEGNDWPFPAITVFRQKAEHGKKAKADWPYIVADGFHRVAAAKQAGLDKVKAEAVPDAEPLKQATLYAVGANAEHGRSRTRADKRNAVMTLLRDGEWSGWADRELARQAKVSNTFVSNLRTEYEASLAEPAPEPSVNVDTCNDKPEPAAKPKARKFKRGGKTHTQKAPAKKPKAEDQPKASPVVKLTPPTTERTYLALYAKHWFENLNDAKDAVALEEWIGWILDASAAPVLPEAEQVYFESLRKMISDGEVAA